MSRHARGAKHAPAARSDAAVSRILNAAIEAHRQGRLEDARQGYTAVLEQLPGHFDALNLLGVVAVQLGQPDVAETLLRLALEVRPRSHEAHVHLAMALRALGRDAEAEAALRVALQLAPNYIDGARNLATLLQSQGRDGEAVPILERAARAAPDNAAVRGNLGALLLCAGRAEEAWPHLRHAARHARADADLLANLGRAGLDTDRIPEGIEACEGALKQSASHVSALTTLSALERVRGRFDAAEQYALQALREGPGDAGAMLNRATALGEMSRYDEALGVLDVLLQTDPVNAQARSSRALVALASGRVEEAWRDHPWRWRLPDAPVPCPPDAGEWQGEAMAQGTLYVWPEQGVGDEIVHASVLTDLQGRAANVVVGCDPRLLGLFGRSFPGIRFVPASGSRLPVRACSATDRQCSIASLSALLRPTLAAFPPHMSYLIPDPERSAQWRQWLDALGPGLKVGISWRSQNLRGERRLACTDLGQWGSVLAVAGVQFVCLQYDQCAAEVANAAKRFGVRIHVPPRLDQRNDIDGVAALMRGLDLVVTAPTTVSMIAGGVGVPTWQLARGIDWYSLGCTHSPWQPAVRKVYRRWDVSWEAVLGDVALELAALTDSHVPPAA